MIRYQVGFLIKSYFRAKKGKESYDRRDGLGFISVYEKPVYMVGSSNASEFINKVNSRTLTQTDIL